MPLFALDNTLLFPPVSLAEPDGLLAIGGDLTMERLLLAYRSGIFPWYEGEHILWWCPDPRFVLFPENLRISKSMRTVFRKNEFEFRVNSSFSAVVNACSEPRTGQDGTWITEEVKHGYGVLHKNGYAHSAEAWVNGKLAGGLYGVRIGNVFFGESMFSRHTNASKFAFISYVEVLRKEGVKLIDCQVYTEHLESLGAEMIPRVDFLHLLAEHLG